MVRTASNPQGNINMMEGRKSMTKIRGYGQCTSGKQSRNPLNNTALVYMSKTASKPFSKRTHTHNMTNRNVSALATGLRGLQVKQNTLKEIQWQHTFVNELPGDIEVGGGPRQVESAFYSRVKPTFNENEPYLIAFSEEAADLLDLRYEV